MLKTHQYVLLAPAFLFSILLLPVVGFSSGLCLCLALLDFALVSVLFGVSRFGL